MFPGRERHHGRVPGLCSPRPYGQTCRCPVGATVVVAGLVKTVGDSGRDGTSPSPTVSVPCASAPELRAGNSHPSTPFGLVLRYTVKTADREVEVEHRIERLEQWSLVRYAFSVAIGLLVTLLLFLLMEKLIESDRSPYSEPLKGELLSFVRLLEEPDPVTHVDRRRAHAARPVAPHPGAQIHRRTVLLRVAQQPWRSTQRGAVRAASVTASAARPLPLNSSGSPSFRQRRNCAHGPVHTRETKAYSGHPIAQGANRWGAP